MYLIGHIDRIFQTLSLKRKDKSMDKNLITHYVSETIAETFGQAGGKVPYKMTNDYLFRAVFQSNDVALKGLICSLLHFKQEEVERIVINNPIEIGKSINSKEFVLDISLTLNNHTKINLEMQVDNRLNWPERALSYACRTFDDLNRGEDYIKVKPVIHIGFLDYELFPDVPEFFAMYKFVNVKNYKVFSDKLVLYVVNLKYTDIATEEDKAYGIDEWAKFFKATTWEEIQMLAEKNSSICEAANAMYDFTSDEVIREHCRMREEYIIRTRGMERWNKMLQEEAEKHLEELMKSHEELEKANEKLEKANDELEKANEELEKTNEELEKTNEKLEKTNDELEKANTKLEKAQMELSDNRIELERVKEETNKEIERLKRELELVKSKI